MALHSHDIECDSKVCFLLQLPRLSFYFYTFRAYGCVVACSCRPYRFISLLIGINYVQSDIGSDISSIFSGLSISSSVSSAVRSNSSIRSGISNYRFEHNRRYHAYRDGNWVMPNDQVGLRD